MATVPKKGRIAQSYMQLIPILSDDFARDIQKAINSALKSVNFSQLSSALRAEGRIAGRALRAGIDAGIAGYKPDVNTEQLVQESGTDGRRAGKALQSAMDNAIGNFVPDINTNRIIPQAGADGRRAGETLQQAFDRALANMNANLPPIQNATQVGQNAGQQVAAGAQGPLDNLKEQIAGILGGAAVGSAVSSGMKGAMEKDAGTREIVASLALTEEQAKRTKEAMAEIFKGGMAEDYAEVETALESALASYEGLRDKPVKDMMDLTNRALVLSRAYEIPVDQIIQVSGQMVENGYAKDEKDATNIMNNAMGRINPLQREEYISMMDEYSKHQENLGFGSARSTNLAVHASQQGGSMGLDQWLDGFKEVGILLSDVENSGTGDALKEIGFNHEQVADNIIAGGDRSYAQFMEITKTLANIKDESDRARLSKAVFGTPLEEMGVQDIDEFLGKIAVVPDTLDNSEGKDIEAQYKAMSDELSSTFDFKMRQLANTWELTFQEVFMPLLEAAIPLLEDAIKWMRENKEFIQMMIPPILILGAVLSGLATLGIWAAIGGQFARLFAHIAVLRAFPGGLAAGFAATYPRLAAFFTGIRTFFAPVARVIGIIVTALAAIPLLTVALGAALVASIVYIAMNWDKYFGNGFFRGFLDAFAGITAGIIYIAEVVTNILLGIMHQLMQQFEGIANFINGIFGTTFGQGSYKPVTWSNDFMNFYTGAMDVPVMDTGGDIMGSQIIHAAKNGEPETIANRGLMNNTMRILNENQKRLENQGMEKTAAQGNITLQVYQLPGQSQQELVDAVVSRLDWESGRR